MDRISSKAVVNVVVGNVLESVYESVDSDIENEYIESVFSHLKNIDPNGSVLLEMCNDFLNSRY